MGFEQALSGGGALARMLPPLVAAAGVAAWLLAGGGPAGLGLADGRFAVALDGLSGLFLAAFLFERALAGAAPPGRDWPARAARLAGGLVVLAAADARLLLVGLALSLVGRRRGLWALGAALGALALFGGGSFAAMRGEAADASLQLAAVPLVLAAAVGLPMPLGPYVAARMLLDVAGDQPDWSAGLVLLTGCGLALAGAASAARTRALAGLLGGFRRLFAGYAIAGVGLAMAGRGADLPLPAAAGVALIAAAVLADAVVGPVWRHAGAMARVVGSGTGVAGLGGVLRPLPGAALVGLGAAAALALLPPGAGFALPWLLLRALPGLPLGATWNLVAALACIASIGLAAQGARRLIQAGLAARDVVPVASLPDRLLFAISGVALLAMTLAPGWVARLGLPAARLLLGEVGQEAPMPPTAGPALALLGLLVVIAVVVLRLGAAEPRVVAPPPVAVTPGARAATGWWRLARRMAPRPPRLAPTANGAMACAGAALLALLILRALT